MRIAIQHAPEQLPLTHKNFESEKLLPVDIYFLLSTHNLEHNAIHILFGHKNIEEVLFCCKKLLLH